MSGRGLDRIPIRAPERWDRAWFERFCRETLALADVRNAVPGTGISISGESSEPATIASSEDLQQFLTQPFVTAEASVLTQSRVIQGDGESIVVHDGGPGGALVVALDYGLALERLAQQPGLSVLATPNDETQETVKALTAAANDRVLARVGDELDFVQLTAGMFPNDVVPDAALSSNAALYDGDVSQFSSGEFADGRISETSVTQHEDALTIDFDQLDGIPQIPGGLQEFADDSAAEVGGIEVNGLYRTGSVVKIRVA